MFKKCKVMQVNEDLTLVILLKYKKELFRWNFKLENIPLLNVFYFKNELEKLVRYKTFEIQVIDFKDGYIHGILFDKYKNKSINSIFSSIISAYETQNSKIDNFKSNYSNVILDTIFEEKETHL